MMPDKPEFPAELVERCRSAVAEADPDGTWFFPYDWVIETVLETARYAELVAERDAAVATLEDEEAAHVDTLRLWNDAKTRNAELVAALEEAQRYQLQMGIPNKWGRDVLARIDRALAAAQEMRERERSQVAMLDCEGIPLKLILEAGFKAKGFALPLQAAEDAIDALAALPLSPEKGSEK